MTNYADEYIEEIDERFEGVSVDLLLGGLTQEKAE